VPTAFVCERSRWYQNWIAVMVWMLVDMASNWHNVCHRRWCLVRFLMQLR